MRVAVFAQDFAPEAGGGYTYETDVLPALRVARDAAGHTILVAGFGEKPPIGWAAESYISLHGTVQARVAGRARVVAGRSLQAGGSPAPLSRVDRLLAAHEIDLVWCLAAGSPTRSLPYVTTIWDLQHRRQPIFPEVGEADEWERRERRFSREIGRASVVIVGTAAGQDEVERFYGIPPERIRQLPHPTPSFALESTGSSDTLKRFALEPGYLLYPAQFWPHKNHVALLRSLRRLSDERGVDLRAVFVGSDKGNAKHVRRVARDLGLGDRVRFLGFVSRADLVELYRNALALAYMSFFGPENLPPLEAFALGCPVLASDVAGAREQLADAALLVPPTDTAAITSGLLKLHADSDLRALLIARGHERARRFTTGDYVQGMLGILDELEPVVSAWR